MTAFRPPEVKLYDDNKKLQYSDVWGLTCGQMSRTLEDLLQLHPNASVTESDLVAYHAIQYGSRRTDVEEMLDMAHESHVWKTWEEAEQLRTILGKIVGKNTVHMQASRIRLGEAQFLPDDVLPETTTDYFDVVEEKDVIMRNMLTLYPKDSNELYYVGGATLKVGRVTIGFVSQELETYTDVLTVKKPEETEATSVLVAHSNTDRLHSPLTITLIH